MISRVWIVALGFAAASSLGVRTDGLRGREGAGFRRVCKCAVEVEPTSKVAALGVRTGGVRCGEASAGLEEWGCGGEDTCARGGRAPEAGSSRRWRLSA